uniref:ferroxidase n=1 Tax=Gouania willdenowi TaxID=441366 RepID=A0A8C5DCQ1_GOUWI
MQTCGLLVICLLAAAALSSTAEAKTERVYYVGIIEDWWDYAPSGKNLLTGESIAHDEHASVFLERGPQRIGSVYKKAMYRQYTDATYSRLSPRPDWLGFLGPVLRAEVDDVIVVHLKNFASRNYSMHPHGVFYEKNTEGALYPDGTSNILKKDDSVPPGANYTYRWEVRPEFAPTNDDSNCLTWVYHSHLDARGTSPQDLSGLNVGYIESPRTDVDQDFFLMFNVVDENLSYYLEDNIMNCSDHAGIDPFDPDFEESNLMHAINGYMFGNLPGMQLCQDHFTLGLFPWEYSFLTAATAGDILSLFPATFATAEMVPKAAGKWLLTLPAGMQAFYEVRACGAEIRATMEKGVVRNFYLVAEKVEWNYAPSEMDLIGNISLTEIGVDKEFFLLFSVMDENMSWYLEENIEKYGSSETNVEEEDFEESNKMHAVNGRMYGNLHGLEMCAGDKVAWYTFGLGTEVDIHGVYFEGNTFERQSTTRDTINLFPHTTLRHSAAIQKHHTCPKCLISKENIDPGNIFVEKGKNRIGSRYKKAVFREYTDETFTVQKKRSKTSKQHLGIIGPIIKAEVGEQIVITFKNKATRPYSINAHGVKPVVHTFTSNLVRVCLISDPNCISYAYFSTVDFIRDLYSGLLGPLVICRRGTLTRSWYLGDNIRKYLEVDPKTFIPDEDFEESNLMHGINGRLYGNLHGLVMNQGQTVDWYLLGMGNEVDMHTVHFHAETFTYKTDRIHRADVFDLFPGTFQTVEMVAGNPGTWLLHCHVTDHIHAGMETTFTIKGKHT